MHSDIAIDIDAPADLVFALAHDVERWATLLPHYARSTGDRARRPTADRVADFVARRPLVPVLGLGLPVAWRSRTWNEPETLRLRFVHVAGATRGMDVTWRIEASRDGRACRVTIEHDFRPRVPGFAAVRRPVLHPPDRGSHAGDVQGARRGARSPGRRRRRSQRHERSTARSGSPASGSSPRSGPASTRSGPGCARATLAGQAHRPVRPVAVPLARSPPRSTTSTRSPACRPRPPASSTGSASSGWSPGGWRSTTPGSCPARPGQPDPERVGIYLGSALGGIAFAEEQHERYLEKGIRQVAPNLALAVFGGAAPANLGIALDVRGPILSTANSCASGGGRARRGAGRPARGPGRRGHRGRRARSRSRRSPSARSTSSGRCRPATTTTPGQACRPFDAERDGFVMGEGAALLVLEDAAAAERRGATPYAELLGLRRDLRRPPHGPAAGRRPRGGPRRDDRARRTPASTPAEIDYVNAHASSTPIGDVAEARALAMALGERAATVPVSGTKALYGHPLGASGAIEAAICALAIRDGWAPASVNLATPEPDARRAAARPAPRGPARVPTGACCGPRSGSAG